MDVGVGFALKTLADRFEPLEQVYRNFTDDAVLAEELGFDFVTMSEHHFEDDAWSPSPLVVLANIAGRTSRVRLATNVLLLPLHQPLRVSEDVATIDILSNGRMSLVCGTGSVLEEFVAFGVDAKSRWGRFWEAMEIIRRSYEEDSFTFEGTHFSIPQPVRQTTKPVQRPFSLSVGGFGAKLQYRSGKNGFHAQGGATFHPEYLKGLSEAGIDPATRNLASFSSGHLAETRHRAWEECREGWWNWQNEYRKRTWIAMLDSPMHAIPPLPPLSALTDAPSPDMPMAPLLGTPDDILAGLQPLYENSDCTHFSFAFRASGGGMPEGLVRPTMRLFAKEVLPTLKTWGRPPVAGTESK